MENLIQIVNNQAVVSSRQIAERFGKEHRNILANIRQAVQSAEISADWFYQTEYIDSKGRTYPEYLMNEEGFTLIVMGFNTKRAIEWKVKYIQAFKQMKKYLKQLQVSSVDKKNS